MIPDEDVPVIPFADEEPVRPAASSRHDARQPEPRSAQPSLQVLADDPVPPRAAHTGERPISIDELPVIPLKPLDDEPATHAARGSEPDEAEGGSFVEETPRRDTFEDVLRQMLTAYEAILTQWIDRLASRGRRLPSPSPAEPAPRAARSSPSAPPEPGPSVGVAPGVAVLAEEPTGPRRGYPERRSTADDPLPIIPLKRLDPAAPPRATLLRQKPRVWASASVDGIMRWLDRQTRRDRPSPEAPPREPSAPSALAPAPREPLKAPPSISELPTLRFADTHEPEVVEDMYEAENVLHPAWRWAKRTLVVTGLVAGGIVAGLNWETWVPKAVRFGQTLAIEIDGLTRSREQAERQRRALEAATGQLPHLGPETIQLVLSGSPASELDPPEVFRLAYDAEARGLSSLGPAEAQELGALRRALLETLHPGERERVRAYDRARAYRVPFPFESRDVLDLFARGARALPPSSRERLQALAGKAVAAGLAVPGAAAPASAPAR